jgi:hypothetical protein
MASASAAEETSKSSGWEENHLPQKLKWPDRSLALMLRDFLAGDLGRAEALRKCRTKKERLALCEEWGNHSTPQPN